MVSQKLLLSPQPLDFEVKSSYTLRIEASNRHVASRYLSTLSFSDVAVVRLLVQNVNEPPVFSSAVCRVVVSEAAPVGTDVGSVAAHDPDATNSPVRFVIPDRCVCPIQSVLIFVSKCVNCISQVLYRQEVRYGWLFQR